MMIIQICSYSIKYRDTCPFTSPNFIFDCRGVKNPGRVDHLKSFTGLDSKVIQFLDNDPSAIDFSDGLEKILINTLPIFISHQYANPMSVGFCCTGGKHRSVYFSEKAATSLRKHEGIEVKVAHLDIEKNYSGLHNHSA